MGEVQKSGAKSHENKRRNEQLEQLAESRAESIREKLEQAERDHKERLSQSDALEAAKDLADKHDTKQRGKHESSASPAERRRGPLTKKQLAKSFDAQMNHVREDLPPVSRAFSKLIHNKTVEKLSDGVGTTLARPNALLSGSIMAFVSVTALYFIAKHYGFQLSGFETIGAFVLGWLLGIVFDYASLMLRDK